MEEVILSSHKGRTWKKLKWKQLTRSLCLVVSRMSGRRLPNKPKPWECSSPFLPAQIEFLFKGFPNKSEEVSNRKMTVQGF